MHRRDLRPAGGARRARAGARLATAVLAAAALLLTTFAATDATAARRAPARITTCPEVVGHTPRSDDLTTVDVLRGKGLDCADARRVVARCIAGRLDDRWEATSPDLVTLLTAGRRQVAFTVVSGPQPACLKAAQPRGLGAGLHMPRNTGEFGPFEGPNLYPATWPPSGTNYAYEWDADVATFSASIKTGSVSTVRLGGSAHNPDGRIRSAWFEWGRTRDLDRRTELQEVPRRGDHGPASFNARLTHLRAGTRYWWRAVANVDTDRGAKRVEGALGSFVTNTYPKIRDPSRPCDSRPAAGLEQGQLFELSESLALACSEPQEYTNSACFPACANFFHGSLQCNKDFPRNLNAGSWSFNVPEIGYPVSVNSLVSYWRSNDSNRFLEVSGKNGNSAGGEVGPTPGWHDWDVAQWAYPATSTRTQARFWINCTEQWGTVIDGSALAAGDGDDVASRAEPGVPTGLRATARDGGIDVDWKKPEADTPSGISGYYLTLLGFKQGEPRVIPASASAPITATSTEGRISPAFLAFYKKYLPANQDMYVVVAAVSREGTVGNPATMVWPAR